MADLLLGGLGLMPAPRRKERTFRLPDDFSLSNFTNEELRSRYRFGRESIKFLPELLVSKDKPCFVDNCACPCSVALFRLRKLSSSYWRYSGPVKVIRVPYNRSSFACPCTETKKLHQVAIDRRGDTSKQTRFFYQGGISWGDWLCWRHSHQDSGTTWKRKRFCQS